MNFKDFWNRFKTYPGTYLVLFFTALQINAALMVPTPYVFIALCIILPIQWALMARICWMTRPV